MALVLLVAVSSSAFATAFPYVYHKTEGCLNYDDGDYPFEASAAFLLSVKGYEIVERYLDGKVIVIDARQHTEIQGYVWYAKTYEACQWIKHNRGKR